MSKIFKLLGELFSSVSEPDTVLEVKKEAEIKEEPIEKVLSYRSSYDQNYYAVKDKNILVLGYELPSDAESESHDLKDRYALFISRGYDNIELQLLDEGTSTAQAQEQALDLVENNRNNITKVSVGLGVDRKFAGRGVFKTVATFAYMGKSEKDEWNELDLEYLEKAGSEAQSILLPTSKYTAAEARSWLKAHGKKSSLDTTDNYHRARQFDPGQCSTTPKTIVMGKGIKAVICTRKSADPVFRHDIEVKMSDFSKGLVYGIVYSPNTKDTHGDWTTAEEIEQAAHNFLPTAKSDWTNINHDGNEVPDVDVVESYIAPVDFKLNGENVSKGSWVIVSRVNNSELRESIQKGEVTGYSLEGTARKVEKD